MKYIILFFCLAILASCKKEPEGEYIGASLAIYVQDSVGNNLLGHTYFEEDIKIYYLNDGMVEEVYDANMATPRNFKFEEIENDTVIIVHANYANTANEPYHITYIEWNAQDTDTLAAHYFRSPSGGTIVLDSAWYNGELLFPTHAYGPTAGIRIVK